MIRPSDVKEALCNGVEIYDIEDEEAVLIKSPFIDHKGSPVKAYLTNDGELTDGGWLTNELRARRVYDTWREWEARRDFLDRYKISEEDGELWAKNPEDNSAVLRFFQGLSSLGGHFQTNPIEGESSAFPHKVRRTVRSQLVDFAPSTNRDEWIEKRMTRRKFVANGYTVKGDFNPVRQDLMVRIFSYQNASDSRQRDHIHGKFWGLMVLEREGKELDFGAVVPDIDSYPDDSRSVLLEESDEIIQWTEQGADQELAELVASE